MDRKFKNMLDAMEYWSKEHNLETDFANEIMNSERLEKWILNNCLMKRFAYFVLEHSDAKDILYRF